MEIKYFLCIICLIKKFIEINKNYYIIYISKLKNNKLPEIDNFSKL